MMSERELFSKIVWHLVEQGRPASWKGEDGKEHFSISADNGAWGTLFSPMGAVAARKVDVQWEQLDSPILLALEFLHSSPSTWKTPSSLINSLRGVEASFPSLRGEPMDWNKVWTKTLDSWVFREKKMEHYYENSDE